jgi:hypothetical protein
LWAKDSAARAGGTAQRHAMSRLTGLSAFASATLSQWPCFTASWSPCCSRVSHSRRRWARPDSCAPTGRIILIRRSRWPTIMARWHWISIARLMLPTRMITPWTTRRPDLMALASAVSATSAVFQQPPFRRCSSALFSLTTVSKCPFLSLQRYARTPATACSVPPEPKSSE